MLSPSRMVDGQTMPAVETLRGVDYAHELWSATSCHSTSATCICHYHPDIQLRLAACLDLMRTSCKIAVQVLTITLMACQASNAVHRKVASVSSYITASEHSFWPGLFAVTIFVVSLHLFDVLCVRRVLTRASMGERVTASAAIFLGVGERLRERLRWMLIVQLW
jgi:hypothetical protein